MGQSGREPADENATVRVSHAIERKRRRGPIRDRLRQAEVWFLVDASRAVVMAALSVAVYLTTIAVGVFGPVSVRQYLLDGTSIAEAYIELQPGVITAITIVLGINQLVLSPEFGTLGRQRQRLEDVISLRSDVEDNAGIIGSPTDPAGFLRTIVDATRIHAQALSEVAAEAESDDLREEVSELVRDLQDEARHVSTALAEQRFGRIELIGASIHFDTTQDIHRIDGLRRLYAPELTLEMEDALDKLQEALNQYTIAREYFRTRYLQSEFIQFSRMMLITGLPAVLIAHYAVGIIGPNALPGSTIGVRNLLWFEAGTLTVTLLPIVVIISYVARIITLAETSIFISPFSRMERDTR